MKTFTKLALATSLAFCFTAPAMADEYKDTLDLLLQKGIITQQEYNTKIEAHTERLENKQFNAARIDKDLRDNNNARFTKANDGSVTENGLGLKSKEYCHRRICRGRCM